MEDLTVYAMAKATEVAEQVANMTNKLVDALEVPVDKALPEDIQAMLALSVKAAIVKITLDSIVLALSVDASMKNIKSEVNGSARLVKARAWRGKT